VSLGRRMNGDGPPVMLHGFLETPAHLRLVRALEVTLGFLRHV